MQIVQVEVQPITLSLQQTIRTACSPPIEAIEVVFIQVITRDGRSAWGCTVADPSRTGGTGEQITHACLRCAEKLPDLHPTHLEYTLNELAPLTEDAPSALVAFDLALHDLLGMISGLPLYRLLGGFRNEIPTSVTIPCGSIEETLAIARKRAEEGYQILKLKGGFDPEEDVVKIKSLRRAFPNHTLRLDADGGYTVQAALDVARALKGRIEMIEQPTPAESIDDLNQVTRNSSVPVLADQSVTTPDTAIQIAAGHKADGFTVKVATCGGIRPATQFDAIARAAKLRTMVSCVFEPRLLIAAGLAIALSSPNVQFTDLDGHLLLESDPSEGGFALEDGLLKATDVPGLGCHVHLS